MNNIPNINDRSGEKEGKAVALDSCIRIETLQDTRNDSSSGSTIHMIIEALEKAGKTLSQDKIRSEKRTNAYERISWAIDQIRELNENPNRNPERQAEHSETKAPASTLRKNLQKSRRPLCK